jgi:hypothetical protein
MSGLSRTLFPMDDKRLKQLLDELAQHAGYEEVVLEAHLGTAPEGQQVFRIKESGESVFATLIGSLLKDPQTRLTSQGYIEATVATALENMVGEKRKASAADINFIHLRFSDLRQEEWRVIRPMHGVTCSVLPTQLGPFTFHRWSDLRPALSKENPVLLRPTEDPLSFAPSEFIVETRVEARDRDFALETANARFRHLDSALRFLTGDLEGVYSPGTFAYRFLTARPYLAISPTGRSDGYEHVGPHDMVDLSAPYFLQAMASAVWGLIAKESRTDLEQRTLAAIDWVGKAIHDEDRADRFVQFMFAIEALLLTSDKGVLITPSISYQLAENAAFILGRSAAKRREVSKEVKDLYGTRSGIVHGGAKEVSRRLLTSAWSISTRLVKSLTLLPPFKGMTSFAQVLGWIEKQRYSVPGDEDQGTGTYRVF